MRTFKPKRLLAIIGGILAFGAWWGIGIWCASNGWWVLDTPTHNVPIIVVGFMNSLLITLVAGCSVGLLGVIFISLFNWIFPKKNSNGNERPPQWPV